MVKSKTTTWQDTVQIRQNYKELSENLNVDVVIIGAGITGITASYLLSKTKLRVALIDKGTIGKESATALTTAMIMEETDTDLSTLVDTFGKTSARLAWGAGRDAIDLIEKIVKKENIDCEFIKVDSFSYATSEKQLKQLEEEVKIAKSIGIDMVIENQNLGFPSVGYVKMRKQAKFHPLKYIKKLADIASKNGVKIFEKTQAKEIVKGDGSLTVITKKGLIFAKDVVMATYSPFTHPLSMYFKAGFYATYMMEAEIKKGMLKEALYEDCENPYHYFRVDPQKGFDRILVGGEDHRNDLPVSEEKSFKALEKYLKGIVGSNYKVIKRWTGPIYEPIDGLPYIGKYDKKTNIYVLMGSQEPG